MLTIVKKRKDNRKLSKPVKYNNESANIALQKFEFPKNAKIKHLMKTAVKIPVSESSGFFAMLFKHWYSGIVNDEQIKKIVSMFSHQTIFIND